MENLSDSIGGVMKVFYVDLSEAKNNTWESSTNLRSTTFDSAGEELLQEWTQCLPDNALVMAMSKRKV